MELRHRTIQLCGYTGQLLEVEPILGGRNGQWLGITSTQEIIEIDSEADAVTHAAQLELPWLDVEGQITLRLDTTGKFCAVANRFGQFGAVMDLESGSKVMDLDRSDYQNRVTPYSLAFFAYNGKPLLIHASDWNRLDISDLASGELLTQRAPTSYKRGEARPDHYLDYFHCELTISPNQEWVVDNGWIWHPMGTVRTWSIKDWLEKNAWESEDGHSARDLCYRDGFWDGPLSWISDSSVAVWGGGEDLDEITPAVRIFEVRSGQETGGFKGLDVDVPKNYPGEQVRSPWMVFDELLFVVCPKNGIQAWDLTKGAVAFVDTTVTPRRFNPKAKEFFTFREDGQVVISHRKLRGNPNGPIVN